MSNLLYIKASPRERSYSSKVAGEFLSAYKDVHTDAKIDVFDIFREELPVFDGDKIDTKYAILHGSQPDAGQKESWREVEAVIERVKSADAYLFSLPMWNFGIPYRLKQLIDVIVQPGYTFSFSPEEGYSGLMENKPAATIYARGGEYAEGTEGEAVDLQKKYMDLVFGFIGLANVSSIIIEPTLAGGPDASEQALNKAVEEARQAAVTL